jgi:hypothetical protein
MRTVEPLVCPDILVGTWTRYGGTSYCQCVLLHPLNERTEVGCSIFTFTLVTASLVKRPFNTQLHHTHAKATTVWNTFTPPLVRDLLERLVLCADTNS